MPPPKKRLPRIERDETSHVLEDENQHLWAVSYSDFLMALLSFFILFFSTEAPQRSQIIMELAGHFNPAGTGSGSFSKGSSTQGPAERMPSSLVASLKDLEVRVNQDHESLIVNFPNDLYMPGQHQFAKNKASLVQDFLKTVKPYQGKVVLYFEGHTDDAPLRIHKNNIVVDNFVLSSLRASFALGYARDMGFLDKNMFIQAAASNLRNSRSLSIRIEPRKEIL